MADIELVIKIPEEVCDDILLTGENTINFGVLLVLRKAVRNSTPLPKRHGRLIDADRLKDKYKQHQALFLEAYGSPMDMPKDILSRFDELNNAIVDIINSPTIIEAESEDKE